MILVSGAFIIFFHYTSKDLPNKQLYPKSKQSPPTPPKKNRVIALKLYKRIAFDCTCLLIPLRYDTARGIIDAIFGPKAHKDFPRNFRLKGGGCDSGFYPASLGGDRSGYKHTGIDLLVEKGDQVHFL